MPLDKPRVNISQELAANFKDEQARFLTAQMQFKSGGLFFGTVAASLLTSMFYILPAARQFAKDKENNTEVGKKFVDDCDKLRLEIFRLGRMKQIDKLTANIVLPLTDDYMELDNRFDALVRQFYLIMHETGFSP